MSGSKLNLFIALPFFLKHSDTNAVVTSFHQSVVLQAALRWGSAGAPWICFTLVWPFKNQQKASVKT